MATCGRGGSTARRSTSSGSAGRPTRGTTWPSRSRRRRELLEDTGLGVRQPPQPPAGLLPGPDPVPDLRRPGTRRGLRRPQAARRRRPEVPELEGGPALQQEPHAVRAELGEGRRRGIGRGGGLRGLHRRDRVLPRRHPPGGRHMRHRADRGPHPPAEAVHQPHRVGLRRATRPARPRPSGSTSGSSATRSSSRCWRCRPARIPTSSPRRTPRRWRRRWPRPRPFLGFRVDRVLSAANLETPEGRARAANAALDAVSEHPSPLVRDQYVMQIADVCRTSPSSSGRSCAIRTVDASAEARAAKASAQRNGRGRAGVAASDGRGDDEFEPPVAPPERTRVRSGAEIEALRLLLQRPDRDRGRSRPVAVHRGAGSTGVRGDRRAPARCTPRSTRPIRWWPTC